MNKIKLIGINTAGAKRLWYGPETKIGVFACGMGQKRKSVFSRREILMRTTTAWSNGLQKWDDIINAL